jgi:hypothetical protein
MRTGDGRKHGCRQNGRQQNFSHVESPHATRKYDVIVVAMMQNEIT